MLSEERGRRLVGMARDAIASAMGAASPDAARRSAPLERWLLEPAATFVTIRRDGELHGCIGSIEPRRPLHEDVRHNATSAAFFDPRATPIGARDLGDLRIEVSLLSALEPIEFDDEADALSKLRPGVDGVVFAAYGRRATFLPQVWASLPEPEEFMTRLKQKAGFDADFWSPDVKLWRYSLQKWSEEEDAEPALGDRSAARWS